MDRFNIGNLTFPVRDTGAPAGEKAAEAVVLLHGFPQGSSCWDALTPALTAAGYRVLAPTQRGYAPGALPKGRRAYRMAELVSDVVVLLDAAGVERAHLVGHDWGGAVAWSVAARAPERLHSLTVMSTPHPAAMRRAMLTSSQGVKSWYMAFFQLPWLPERLLDPRSRAGRERFVRSLVSSGQDPVAAERDAEAMSEPGVLTGALNWYRGLPISGTPVGAVSVPTRYIWSRGDKFLGAKAARLTAKYVTGPYELCEVDGNHWLPDRDADLIAGLLLPHLAAHPAVGLYRNGHKT